MWLLKYQHLVITIPEQCNYISDGSLLNGILLELKTNPTENWSVSWWFLYRTDASTVMAVILRFISSVCFLHILFTFDFSLYHVLMLFLFYCFYDAGDRVQSLGQEYLLEKEMATHSSILAWKIPRMQEPGRATVHGVTVGHDWATSLSLFIIWIKFFCDFPSKGLECHAFYFC